MLMCKYTIYVMHKWVLMFIIGILHSTLIRLMYVHKHITCTHIFALVICLYAFKKMKKIAEDSFFSLSFCAHLHRA